MTEEDLSALVTSIDENDIEIIPSNDSDNNDEQLEFLPDHFAISQRPVTINREDSDTEVIIKLH